MSRTGTRTLRVDYLARVEGEGSLTLRLRGEEVVEARLRIFEAPRLFEAFLVGRRGAEAPDVTSRVCGICPVAYLMSSCAALEDALGIEVSPEIAALRRLLYCGEWIESHCLHVFLLALPDFFDLPDALALAKARAELVQRGLRMKQGGNSLVARLGGRAIHPVSVRVGGFTRTPAPAELAALLPELTWAQGAARETIAQLATLPYPELERDYELVALRHPDEYPMCRGRLVSSRGLDVPVSEYDAHFEETQVEGSTALVSHRRGGGPYLCGPLARYNLNFDRLAAAAREAALAAGLTPPVRNPFRGILVRMVEVLHAFDEAARIIQGYRPPARAWHEAPLRAGTGFGVTEAPRGCLYHRYTLDEDGLIRDAKLVPPTSQSIPSIEGDLVALGPRLAQKARAVATLLAERAVRNHDPCISCATHFLRLKVEQVG